MYEDPKSKISQLENILDAKEDLVTKKIKRHELHSLDGVTKKVWSDEEFEPKETEITQNISQDKGLSFSLKILLGSVIFFIIALGLAAYKFIGGGYFVSDNNIEVSVKAPVSVAGGGVFSFEIEVKNNNQTALSAVDLGVVFPSGAKEVANPSISAKRSQTYLGDILPGQSVKKNLSVVLYGVENEKKDINLNLEYKIPGSNSAFNKTKSISVLISSSPVNIIVTGSKEINTNQNVDFSVDVVSNSSVVIKGLLLSVEYPFGFSFTSSNPKTFSKNNLWLIGDLEPGAKRTIKFSGVLTGQEGEERGFNFSLGSQSASDNLTIDVPFASSFSSVTIRRPFVSADILFNGEDTQTYVSKAGEKIETVINWQNNLPYEVSDVSINVKIAGNILNKASVSVGNGFYRSIDNTIVFDKTTNSAFANLESGAKGVSKFTFSSFGTNSVTGAGLNSPTITLDISVKGHRVDYTSGQDDIYFSDSRKIRISSDPQLFAKSLYYVGAFQNSGPVPPKVDRETTYTVNWTITNPLNNLSNVQVSTILPPSVKWLGAVSPDKEKIDYKEDTRILTWNVGSVSAGAGSVLPAKEVSFQVSLLPSVDQAGAVAKLTGLISLTGKDNFTLTDVSDSFSAIDTMLTSDPYFKANTEKVVQ